MRRLCTGTPVHYEHTDRERVPRPRRRVRRVRTVTLVHYECTLFRTKDTPWSSWKFPGCARSDFRRFSVVLFNLGEFSVGMLPNQTQFPGSWVGTQHYLKSALVCADSEGTSGQALPDLGFRV
jgi:hypothetical protein